MKNANHCFSIILFAPAYSKEGAATTVPAQLLTRLPTLATLPTSMPSVSRDAIQKYAGAEIETQTVNGIEMSASNFRVDGRYLKVNICFVSPNNKEWMVGEGVIRVGEEKYVSLEKIRLK